MCSHHVLFACRTVKRFFETALFALRPAPTTFSVQTTTNRYNKPIMKTEKGGLCTFSGVFDPGNVKIGPAFLIVRLAFFRDAIQRRLFAVSLVYCSSLNFIKNIATPAVHVYIAVFSSGASSETYAPVWTWYIVR